MIAQVALELCRDIRVRKRTPPTSESVVSAIEDILGSDGVATLTKDVRDTATAIDHVKTRIDELFAEGGAPERVALPALFVSAIADRPSRSNSALTKAEHILKFSPDHVPALNLKASILLDRCKFEDAQRPVASALNTVMRDTSPGELVLARDGLARIHMSKGEMPEALHLFRQNLELVKQAQLSHTTLGDAHERLAWVHFCNQNYELAAYDHQDALRAYEAAGNNLEIAHSHQSLSRAHSAANSIEPAIGSARKAAEHAEKTKSRRTIAACLENLGETILEKRHKQSVLTDDDLAEAESAARRAVKLYECSSVGADCIPPLVSLISIAEEREDWNQAIEWARQVLAKRQRISCKEKQLALDHQRLGRLLEIAGQSEEAESHHANAVKLIGRGNRRNPDPLSKSWFLAFGFRTTAHELEQRSLPDRAARLYRYVVEARRGAFSIDDLSQATTEYAAFLARHHQTDEAQHYAKRARKISKKCSCDELRVGLEEILGNYGL